MNIKIKLVTLLTVFFIGAFASAQDEENKKCADYFKGTYTLKNGKTKEGYIFIDQCNPQLFQQNFSVIDQKTYTKYKSGKRIKNKAIESFKVKEIKGFVLENGRKFKQVKYVDLSATSKVGMLPKRFLFEVVADGDITVYRKFYRTKNGFIHRPVMDSRLAGGAEHIDFMTSNFEVLIQNKEEKNPKNIKATNIKRYFGNNQELMEKYINGDYEFKIQLQRESSFASNCDQPFLNALLEMVSDYNGTDRKLANTTFDN